MPGQAMDNVALQSLFGGFEKLGFYHVLHLHYLLAVEFECFIRRNPQPGGSFAVGKPTVM